MRQFAPFVHDYYPGAIHYGEGCITSISDELEKNDAKRILVVCGESVGQNEAIIDPIKASLEDKLTHVFAGTSKEKTIETAYEGLRLAREKDIDAVVGVGAGSSLDLAKAISALHTDDRPPEDIERELATGRAFEIEDDLGVYLAVPTTFAGADLSMSCSLNFHARRPDATQDRQDVPSARFSDPALMPDATFYDFDFYSCTPFRVLAGSAINGFNKAIEKLYSPSANPITDSTAVEALRLLREGLSELRGGSNRALERSIVGTILAQYGWNTNDSTKISILHAFGHAFSYRYQVQQGVVHGIVTPSVLRYVFENIDGRRRLVAEGLGVKGEDDEQLAREIINAVDGIRDDLGLPSRLKEIEGLEEAHLPDAARTIMTDRGIDRSPPGLEPDMAAVETILKNAW